MGGCLACCVCRDPDAGRALLFAGRELSAPQREAEDAATCVALAHSSSGPGDAERTQEEEDEGQKLVEGGQEGRQPLPGPAAANPETGPGQQPPPPPPEQRASGSGPGRELPPEREAEACLLVQGFPAPQSLDGQYVMVPGASHHGHSVFRRPRQQETVPGKGRRLKPPAVLYFWDERDGVQHCGWCFGPHVGSKTIWAFSPSDAEAPPVVGWRQPWYSEVLPCARVFPVAGLGATLADGEVRRAEELLEAEACPPDPRGRLTDALAAFRAPLPLHVCVDCRRSMHAPCALPCGHLVCLEHVSKAPGTRTASGGPAAGPPSPAGEDAEGAGAEKAGEPGVAAAVPGEAEYKCPCSPECHTYPQSGGVALDGWGLASVAQQLMALAGLDAQAEPRLFSLKSSAFWEETAGQAVGGLEGAKRGVLACDTPMRLIAAYEWLGHEAGLAGQAAEAAAAFAAARWLHCAFLGEEVGELPETPSGDDAGPERLGLGACARRELMERAVRWQREAGAKAAAWAKRCGCQAQLAAAAAALPAPPAKCLAAEGRSVVEALRPRRAAARQLLDCPVCYRLLHEPTTTPCGHTLCRGCLARVLDGAGGCPLCRAPLRGCVAFYAACGALQRQVEELFPEESAAREAERAAELTDAHVGDADHLPMLLPGTLALPYQRFVFHVSQPHHRLMMRRAIESGQGKVGMCLSEGPQGFSECGVELCLRWVRIAADGRSAVECVGGRRFRVIQSFMHDGYSIAKVDFETEDGADTPEARAARAELLASASELRRLAGARPGREEPDVFPPLEEVQAWDAVGWVVLAQVPAPAAAKYRCLELRSRAQRLAAIAALVRELLASLSASATAAETASAAEGGSAAGAGQAAGGLGATGAAAEGGTAAEDMLD